MINRYGLDVDYFKRKLKIIIRDVDNYTPSELARELARMSRTSDSKVLLEEEFSIKELGYEK